MMPNARGAASPQAPDPAAAAEPGPVPVVAVVGRPNVGKSTLVNRILGRRQAVVEDIPGVTRDRVAYDATWSGRAFTLVDTGGWDPAAKGAQALAARVAGQARLAVDAADAVMNTLTAASGATTVPMSRPSATMPPASAQALAMISCCRAIRCLRTPGTEATALTALDTGRPRIGPVTSAPSTVTEGWSGSVLTSIAGPAARAATAAASVTSMCRDRSHQVSARYMAPVSR